MSDTITKQPAHEVVLQKLGAKIADLKCLDAEGRVGSSLELEGQVTLLCGVLAEMFIPPESLSKLNRRLHEFWARCPNIASSAKESMRRLLHELQTEEDKSRRARSES